MNRSMRDKVMMFAVVYAASLVVFIARPDLLNIVR